jgi:tetrahydromethanopterin S-methyltransferase subunit B
MDNETTKAEETFKDRLLREKSDLEEKMQKLNAFQLSEKFAEIDPVQMTLMNIQFFAMQTYSQILTERIARID